MQVRDRKEWDDEDAWMRDALCAQVDKHIFFPGKGESDLIRTAKRVCARCPVRVECLGYALLWDINFGVWGGASETDRRRMLGKLRRSKPRDAS